MTHENKVVKSMETPDGGRCVDIFTRPDGTFGFEEFRRDIEDALGWFPIGCHSGQVFPSTDAALEQALKSVPWLADVVSG